MLIKQAFAKVFAKILLIVRDLFDVFASFLKFSDLLRPVRIHSDAFGCIRMRLDAFGCVQTLSGKFGKFLFVRSFVRSAVGLAFDRNGGARLRSERGAPPFRSKDQKEKIRSFGRRASI